MKCPHCKAKCKAEVLLLSAKVPYRCPSCGRNSKFRRIDNAIAGGLGAGLLTFEFSYLTRMLEHWFQVVSIFTISIALVIYALWKFVKLHPAESKTNTEPEVGADMDNARF